jgi:hypothetical protein
MELTMARDFKRGEPVVYYGNGRATRCFFGGKNGGYRVLSSTPDLESGWLVPLSSVLSEVFPAPNEHGVYAQDLATRIEYRGSATFHVAVDYLQIGPERWIAASEFRIGTRYRSKRLLFRCCSISDGLRPAPITMSRLTLAWALRTRQHAVTARWRCTRS